MGQHRLLHYVLKRGSNDFWEVSNWFGFYSCEHVGLRHIISRFSSNDTRFPVLLWTRVGGIPTPVRFILTLLGFASIAATAAIWQRTLSIRIEHLVFDDFLRSLFCYNGDWVLATVAAVGRLSVNILVLWRLIWRCIYLATVILLLNWFVILLADINFCFVRVDYFVGLVAHMRWHLVLIFRKVVHFFIDNLIDQNLRLI